MALKAWHGLKINSSPCCRSILASPPVQITRLWPVVEALTLLLLVAGQRGEGGRDEPQQGHHNTSGRDTSFGKPSMARENYSMFLRVVSVRRMDTKQLKLPRSASSSCSDEFAAGGLIFSQGSEHRGHHAENYHGKHHAEGEGTGTAGDVHGPLVEMIFGAS